MTNPNFIDYVKINCRSGKGGEGSIHFRREKYVPRGGPDGGDGGRGGHIVLKGNKHLWTLLHLKYTKHIRAESGKKGGAQRSTGAAGKDEIIEVPLGTVAKNAEDGTFLCEITEDNKTKILLEGGMGGLGNDHFKSSTNQSPKYAQPGQPGKEAWIILELKLLADVGLVGFPNAGKSTLLSVVSAAKPEIADYPFTTLKPNLGLVAYRDYRSFVMADIPGIIENAHKGKGLGLRFLRHIERNSLLLFLVPADADDIRKEYNILLNELKQYSPELLHKERILAISKSDMLDQELMNEIEKDLPEVSYLFVSALKQKGLNEIKDMIWSKIGN